MKVDIVLDDKDVLKGLDKLEKGFPNVVIAIKKEFGAEAVIQGKQFFTPVDKGNLISTLRVEVRKGKVFFVSGGIMGKGTPSVLVDYADFVNRGTSLIEPTFFMEKSVASASLDVESFSHQILRSWLANINS